MKLVPVGAVFCHVSQTQIVVVGGTKTLWKKWVFEGMMTSRLKPSSMSVLRHENKTGGKKRWADQKKETG